MNDFNNQQPNMIPPIPQYGQPQQNPQMKPCKKCGTMLYKGTKVCPVCGKKVGSGIGCGIVAAILAFIVIVPIAAGGSDSGGSSSDSRNAISSQVAVVAADTETEATKNDKDDDRSTAVESRPVEYQEIYYTELYNKSDEYQDEYVKTYGKISEIDEDFVGTVYISFKDGVGDGNYDSICCYMLESEGKKVKEKYSVGDYVEVTGQVGTSILGTLSIDDCSIVADGDNIKQKLTDYEQKQQQEIAAAKEEYKKDCQTYTYEEIARNPSDYEGKKAKFEGQVIQVLESGNDITLRIDITKEANEFAEGGYLWSDTIYVEYTRKASNESRILEDDIITVYGTMNGTKSYTTIVGSETTIPFLQAEYVDIPN